MAEPELLCILAGPRKIIDSRPDGDRWCFHCRKRLAHTLVMLDYDEDSPHRGWYDPVVVRRCAGCGEDHTEFPQAW